MFLFFLFHFKGIKKSKIRALFCPKPPVCPSYFSPFTSLRNSFHSVLLQNQYLSSQCLSSHEQQKSSKDFSEYEMGELVNWEIQLNTSTWTQLSFLRNWSLVYQSKYTLRQEARSAYGIKTSGPVGVWIGRFTVRGIQEQTAFELIRSSHYNTQTYSNEWSWKHRNPLKTKLVYILFKNSVRTSKRTPNFTITKINWLTLFKFEAEARLHFI
jgi:hypothetical protein